MIIYACSTNQGKLAEFAMAGQESGVIGLEITVLPGISSIPPPEETGVTFEENAAQKALYYSTFTTEFVIADDSGLQVEALNGAPGIYSARYAGHNAVAAANNALLLKNLINVSDRRARFVCAIALARQGVIVTEQKGIVEGAILTKPRGTGGFGYDPLFFYPPLNRAMAELSEEQKFLVSHRGNALRHLFEWTRDYSQ